MSRMLVDADAIRALAEILTDTNLTEIEISEKDSRIRVARASATVVGQAVAAPVAAAPVVEAPVAAAPADLSKHPGALTSPMVGVAYLTADPSSPPYVTVGQTIAAGQTVMLIEAMKTFSQIKATKGGTVTQILVASGDPVEFGQPLIIVE
jgi:acetyl-CoA carboxylase biotin carboxyl carrier protein